MPSTSLINSSWPFNNSLNDEYGSKNGISTSNLTYISPGITGQGYALNFNESQNQSVSIDASNNLNLSYSSFTFELWIYPYSLATDPYGDHGLIGLCEMRTQNHCLHITLRSDKVRMSFFANACQGSTTIVQNKWYHVTAIFDHNINTQFLYLNGILDCINSASSPLQITNLTSVLLTFGVTYPLSPYYYTGLIDQISLVGWRKNATEILNDATQVAHYSFNKYSPDDQGINRIRGNMFNITYSNHSLLFTNTPSYFQISSFVLLGIENYSYSFSIWIKTLNNNSSTILHSSQNTFGVDQWCLPLLGLTSTGRIAAQTRILDGVISVLGPMVSINEWTHIVQTYTSNSSLKLYINGSLYNSSTAFKYYTNGKPVVLTLGSSFDNGTTNCTNQHIQTGQYQGWIDEFRIYSRALNDTDVESLSLYGMP
jgi:hypothetical protein